MKLWLCLVAIFATSATASQQFVEAPHAMVVSQQPIASAVGLEVLRAGGNAVDAAVATALALAVVHPQAGNIGGGGFLVYHRQRDSLSTCIDFRETAPAAAHRDLYLDARGEVDTVRVRFGVSATGVPGTPAGLSLAWSKYGTLPWRTLVAPAILLANEGFPINAELAESIAGDRRNLSRHDATRALFLPNGKPLRAGERLIQRDLARTLKQLAVSGPLAFYEGTIAELLVKEMQAGGGLVTMDDLARYRAIERPPLRGRYRDLEIVTVPPPSSGGVTLLQMLAMLEPYDLSQFQPLSTQRVHLTSEVMARAFADRNTYLGDPDFVRLPLVGMLDPVYIASLRASIVLDRATAEVRPGDPWVEHDQTTHISVVDDEGNCVSLTTTLNDEFGCRTLVTGAGFLLNNEMDDFSAKPGAANLYLLTGTEANAIAPGKRMLSSMTPTIVFRNRRPWLVVGSPGGPRIITTVLNVVLDVHEHGMSLQDAVAAPRFHHQWSPNVLWHEPGAFAPEVARALQAMGHVLRQRSRYSSAQCVEITPDGMRRGASDPRSQGSAAGY